ncbi:MAG: hypothetical protein JRJ31_00220 [Deltaproteobacteria bacterium]|nr:hypothetical protein [Deltaproteobacteria bacterium]
MALAAQFPNNTLWPELAIGARIGACLAILQTFPAVTYVHFLAANISFAIRVVATGHVFYLQVEIDLSRPQKATALAVDECG